VSEWSFASSSKRRFWGTFVYSERLLTDPLAAMQWVVFSKSMSGAPLVKILTLSFWVGCLITIEAFFLDDVKEITVRMSSSDRDLFNSRQPSAVIASMKNLKRPCSVTLPLGIYFSVNLGSLKSLSSILADELWRTPWSRRSQTLLPSHLTFWVSC